MTDPESAYALISAELARRRAPSLQRAALTWTTESDAQPILAEDCCAAGDFDDAA